MSDLDIWACGGRQKHLARGCLTEWKFCAVCKLGAFQSWLLRVSDICYIFQGFVPVYMNSLDHNPKLGPPKCH